MSWIYLLSFAPTLWWGASCSRGIDWTRGVLERIGIVALGFGGVTLFLFFLPVSWFIWGGRKGGYTILVEVDSWEALFIGLIIMLRGMPTVLTEVTVGISALKLELNITSHNGSSFGYQQWKGADRKDEEAFIYCFSPPWAENLRVDQVSQ